MKLICPNNPNHKEFIAVAHVSQEWTVDANGEFVSVEDDCLDVLHKPSQDDYFDCKICGMKAQVK